MKAAARAVVGSLLLAACAGPEPVPVLEREIHQGAAAAREAFTAGDLVRARILYTHALAGARLSDDALALGNLAYNLAVVVAEQGDHTGAEALLAEAAAALVRAKQPLDDVTLLRARVQWRAGDASAAERTLAALDAGAPRHETTLLRGELACARKDVPAAKSALAALAAALGEEPARTENPSLLALAASVAETEGRAGDAAALQDRAADALRGAGEYRRMAQALARAGAAHLAADAPVLAGDRFLRAAQSRLGARDRPGARLLLQRATACAEQSGDADLGARVRACARDLGDVAAPTATK